MALHIGIGNFSGAIAANIYRSEDSPRFLLGRKFNSVNLLRLRGLTFCFADGVELMFVGIGFIFLPIVVFLYKRINAQRDATERLALEKGEKVQYSDQELRELGDRAPDFRYAL
jgi:hypothetical protein